jgi:hypothetical protein
MFRPRPIHAIRQRVRNVIVLAHSVGNTLHKFAQFFPAQLIYAVSHHAFLFQIHTSRTLCVSKGRLTKIKHPWANGQVERMNRTIKDATVKRYHYDDHAHRMAAEQGFDEAQYYRVLGIQPSTGQIVPREEVNEKLVKDEVRRKLKLYEGSGNRVGAYRRKGSKRGSQKFTKTYLENSLHEEDRKRAIAAASTFIRHHAKVPSAKVGWTTFKDFRGKLSGPRYTDDSCFISINARASNDYADREAMIYLANRFSNPALLKYLKAKGVEMEEDLWALSEMLQWLWRGCIRKCPREPLSPDMHVFIPSYRMRHLFKAWIGSDTYDELRSAI